MIRERLRRLYLRHYDRQMDRRLGVSTCELHGWKNPVQLTNSQFQDATASQPTWYRDLEVMGDWFEMDNNDHLLDMGCGRGRVLLWAAQQGRGRVSGVEADLALAQNAEVNLRDMSVPSRVYCQDAATYTFSDETLLFFFNPFGAFTMAAVMDNLAVNLAQNPRTMRIIYSWDHHHLLLETLPWIEKLERRGRCSLWQVNPPQAP